MAQVQIIKHLLIKLTQIEINEDSERSNNQQVYFSFRLNLYMHFTPFMPMETSSLDTDILISAYEPSYEVLTLYRWENHMIMHTFQIDLAWLKSKSGIVKKMQTKSGQILKFSISGLADSDIKFGDKYLSNITQHYLFIDKILIVKSDDNKNQGSQGPSFIKIKTDSSQFAVPIVESQVLIKLPQNVQFSRIRNGKQIGRSDKFSPKELKQSQMDIKLDSVNYRSDTTIKVSMKWGINFSQAKPENALLQDSQQIMIYDIEIKFDNLNEFGNCLGKLVYTNKAFDLGADFSSSKPSKIRKIINFTVKSEDQQIHLTFEKKQKVVAQAKVQVEQILPMTVYSMKKKIVDINGKQVGSIKMKCEKGKNLSTPSNNRFWRENTKNKSVLTLLIIFDQMSVKSEQKSNSFILNIKSDSETRQIKKVPNYKWFEKDNRIVSNPVTFLIKNEESIYLTLRQGSNTNESDFIGIALFTSIPLRFGLNCADIKFFKNQIHTITLNCLIHKIPGYPFMKPSFQPQIVQQASHRSFTLSIVMREVYLTPYYYTYSYQNKNEVYCVVQVNKSKKVLIMQNKNKSNELYFTVSASSDNLDFTIEETETIKMKITLLVSDIGSCQEIYGFSHVKFKFSDLQAATPSLKFYLVQIKNEFSTNLGQANFQVHKASLFNSHEKQSRDVLQTGRKTLEGEKRKIKMHLAQISQSVQLKQKSFGLKNQPNLSKRLVKQFEVEEKKLPPRYQRQRATALNPQNKGKNNKSVIGVGENLKLPAIRQESASPKGKKSYNELVQMMIIRKRSVNGHYQQNSMLQPYHIRQFQRRNSNITNHQSQDLRAIQGMYLKQKIQKQNPNLSRNMEILFPKRSARGEVSHLYKRPISEEEKKLKGLKSVLNQISSDLGEVEPTVKDFHVNKEGSAKIQEKIEIDHLHGPEWNDNQFAV